MSMYLALALFIMILAVLICIELEKLARHKWLFVVITTEAFALALLTQGYSAR